MNRAPDVNRAIFMERQRFDNLRIARVKHRAEFAMGYDNHGVCSRVWLTFPVAQASSL